ncbi:MAG: TolC family outer membrane protein [Magnetococcales bacterium]|nr:TolC family outer membrane protein [Magnetococcales bacterium]
MPHRDRNHKRFRTLLSGSILALAIGLLPAQGRTDVMAFWQAVDTAQARNPQIHRAEAVLRAAREDSPKTLAKLLPNVNLRAVDVLREGTHYDRTGNRTSQHSDPRTVALSVDQRLFNAPFWIDHSQSDLHVEGAYADVMAIRQEIALRVATISSNWLEAKEVYDLATKYIKVTQHHLDENTLRLNAGESTETDVQQAASRANQAQASLQDALNTLEKETSFFREVVGSNPDPGLALPEYTWEEPKDLENLIWKWIEDRPEIWAARARLGESAMGEEMERAAHLPTLDLNYTTSRTWDAELGGSGGRSDKADENAHSVSLIFNLPIFNGMETVSKTREAKAMKEAAMTELDRLRTLARREVEEARFDLKNNKAAIVALEKALTFSEKASAGLQESFHAGTRTLMDVLDAQFEVYTLRTNLVRHRYQAQLAVVRLWKALGRSLQPTTPARIGTHVESVQNSGASRDDVTRRVREQTVNALEGRNPSKADEGIQLLLGELEKDQATPQPTYAQQTRPLKELKKPDSARQPVRPDESVMTQNKSNLPLPNNFPEIRQDGGFMVHVGTFTQHEDLAAKVRALAAAGIPSWSERVHSPDEKEMTRLLVGPFTTHAKVMEAMTFVNRKTGHSIGWVPVLTRSGEPDGIVLRFTQTLEELIP